MNYYILALAVLVFGFFVDLDFLIGFWGDFIIKIALFVSFIFLFKKEQKQTLPTEKTASFQDSPKPKPPAPSSATTSRENISVLDCLTDEQHHVKAFLKGQFEILFNYLVPANGYVFLNDKENNTYLIYKSLKNEDIWNESHETPAFITLLKNSDRDIIIENHIESSVNIIPFYKPESYVPASLFAMQTQLENGYTLYWAFDSQAPGHFNEEELILPGQVNFSTEYVLNNIIRYENLLQENYDTARLMQLAVSLNSAGDFEQALQLFVDAISKEFVADKLTIAMREKNGRQPGKAVIEKSIGQEDFLKAGQKFTMEEGLHGWVIIKNKAYLIEDMEKGEYFIPRFSNSEKTNYGLRSFLSVPLGGKEESIGMVSLEHKRPSVYKTSDKNKLYMYINLFSSVIKRFTEKEEEAIDIEQKKGDEHTPIP